MGEIRNVYYPQNEMNTVLLPVATGCPYNQCAFCSMYKDEIYQEFVEAGVREKRDEIKVLIENLDVGKKVEFDTTHATNLVKLQGSLPEQREEFIEKLED